MNDLQESIKVIVYFAPVFSSAVCAFVLLLSPDSGFMSNGATLKRILLGYFMLTAFSACGVFCYNYFPVAFTRINALVMLAMVVIPVLFCDFIYYAMAKKRLPRIHYLIPLGLFGLFFAWSLFIPFDSQLELTLGKGELVSDLKAYSIFYLSKPFLRSLFGIGYTLLAVRYFLIVAIQADLKEPYTIKYLKSIGIILLLAILFQVFSLGSVITPRDSYFTSIWSVASVVAILGLHTMFVYHLLGENIHESKVSLRIADTKQAPEVAAKAEDSVVAVENAPQQDTPVRSNSEPKSPTKKLNKKEFESYIRSHKPYLNPDYKITDLAAELAVNRSYVSDFINRSYGVNFNTYINNLRLREFNRLRKLVANKGKTLSALAKMAGFSNYRTYIRAKTMNEQ